jgi:hypothetical protein
MGLVGLELIDPSIGPQRAAGMQGLMVGYVVSHPALQTDLRVPAGTDGHPLPVLAFRVTSVVTREAHGKDGPEELRGRGTLDVFFNPDGFSDDPLHYPPSLAGSQKIESDRIEFAEKTDYQIERYHLHLRETAIATWAFDFAGRSWQTPVGRTADSELIGQYSDIFSGDTYASTSVLSALSPEENLIAVAGSPLRSARF